jgi:hypothetical protein
MCLLSVPDVTVCRQFSPSMHDTTSVLVIICESQMHPSTRTHTPGRRGRWRSGREHLPLVRWTLASVVGQQYRATVLPPHCTRASTVITVYRFAWA